MVFRNKALLEVIEKSGESWDYLGQGAQGICFLNQKNNNVYKIFYDALDGDYLDDSYRDIILRFKDIKNDTFKFANDLIIVDDKIFGYISEYVEGEPLIDIDPLKVNLDDFEKNLIKAKEDIKTITLENNIVLYDVMFNILYGNRFYVKDFDEFAINKTSDNYLIQNYQSFDYEIYFFLVSSLFERFVKDNKELKELYESKNEDVLIFMNLFRKHLGEYCGKKINYLDDAKKCMDKENYFKQNIEYPRLYKFKKEFNQF